MRISDWSSDVCSSDLAPVLLVAILILNLVLAARVWYRDAGIRFTAEELALRSLHFDGLSAASARRLIDQGHWISARRGEVLIRENQAAPSLFYLAERAEEHTSELQSLMRTSYAVLCLKKKKK